MADRPAMGDDDEVTRPPEVTVPPWLRTGPTPTPADHAAPAGRPGPEPGPAAEPAMSAEPGPAAGPAQAPAPHRIRLGDDPPAPPRPTGRRARLAPVALLVAGGLAVLAGSAVVGYLLVRGATGGDPGTDAGAPAAAPADHCPAVEGPGLVSGDGPGSLDTPAGAVLAFDHAYYVERSAAGAFEAVSPSSRMSEERLRTEGVDRLSQGTRHCVQIRELSPELLDVTLTETPPDAEPVTIRQRVRVAQAEDGSWGIVSITPAG